MDTISPTTIVQYFETEEVARHIAESDPSYTFLGCDYNKSFPGLWAVRILDNRERTET